MKDTDYENLSVLQLLKIMDSMPAYSGNDIIPVTEALCERLGLNISDYDMSDFWSRSDCFEAIFDAVGKRHCNKRDV